MWGRILDHNWKNSYPSSSDELGRVIDSTITCCRRIARHALSSTLLNSLFYNSCPTNLISYVHVIYVTINVSHYYYFYDNTKLKLTTHKTDSISSHYTTVKPFWRGLWSVMICTHPPSGSRAYISGKALLTMLQPLLVLQLTYYF